MSSAPATASSRPLRIRSWTRQDPDGREVSVLAAYASTGRVAELTYFDGSAVDDAVSIDWVESRSPGAATALVRSLVRRHPGRPLTTPWFTGQGRAFADRLAASTGIRIVETDG